MIDVIHTINAVQRQVGTSTLEAGDARTITISRSYGSCRSPVTCASAGATSSRATPAARSTAAYTGEAPTS